MVGKWTNEPRSGVDEVVNHFWVLTRCGVDSILHRCLTHEEAKVVLNDFHGGPCGGHLSGLSTTQKILRAGYFWSC